MASIPVPFESNSIIYSTIPPYTLQIHGKNGEHNTLLQLPSEVASDQSGAVQIDNSTSNSLEDHLAIRLRGPASRPAPPTLDLPRAYFSAAHLQSRAPDHLACSTCSNPIVSTAPKEGKSTTYTALPSEHWEELIDSWMCHSDQLLNVSVTRGREGLEDNSRITAGEIRVADGYIVCSVQALIGKAIQHVINREVSLIAGCYC